jgi:hypothetical protein
MSGYFVALKEMFCTSRGLTHPRGCAGAEGSAPPPTPGAAHGHGSDSQKRPSPSASRVSCARCAAAWLG